MVVSAKQHYTHRTAPAPRRAATHAQPVLDFEATRMEAHERGVPRLYMVACYIHVTDTVGRRELASTQNVCALFLVLLNGFAFRDISARESHQSIP